MLLLLLRRYHGWSRREQRAPMLRQPYFVKLCATIVT
jgi:hypothetical protein